MSSKHIGHSKPSRVALAGWLLAMGVAVAAAARVDAQRLDKPGTGDARRFYADDPLWVDADMRNIPPVALFELSKSYEFVNETFGDSVRSRGRALNVNTLDEVPDSSWFTNGRVQCLDRDLGRCDGERRDERGGRREDV